MSVNKSILLGHVGKDPEIRVLDGGVKVATLSLATTERGYTTGNGTQVPERTEWHNLVFWRGLAETVEKYVSKGSKIYVEGKTRTRSYDGQDGTKRYVTEVHVDNIELLTPKQAATVQAAPMVVGASQPTPQANGLPGFGDTKDNLPF